MHNNLDCETSAKLKDKILNKTQVKALCEIFGTENFCSILLLECDGSITNYQPDESVANEEFCFRGDADTKNQGLRFSCRHSENKGHRCVHEVGNEGGDVYVRERRVS